MKWLDTIKCSVGFHAWEYYAMSWEFIKAFPTMGHVNRFCRCCKVKQVLADNKHTWQQSAWGTLGVTYERKDANTDSVRPT